MTSLEKLQSYGLATDKQSVLKRLHQPEFTSHFGPEAMDMVRFYVYWHCVAYKECEEKGTITSQEVDEIAKDLYAADVELLCEYACGEKE